MMLSLSVKAGNIVDEKVDFLESLFIGHSVKKNEMPLEKISEWSKAKQIEGIELVLSKNTTDKNLGKIHSILSDNKIRVLSIHQPIKQLIKINISSINRIFEVAEKFSAKLIVIHLFALGKDIQNRGFIEQLSNLEKKYGVKISLENSTKNFLTNLGRSDVWDGKLFSEAVRKMPFGITFDTTHMGYSKGDIVNFYRDNQDKVLNIHLSDFKGGLLGMHRPLGKGILPITQLLQLLKDTSYQGLLTLEVSSGGWEALQESICLSNSFIGK